MPIIKNYFSTFASIVTFFIFSIAVFGQQNQYSATALNGNSAAFPNPLLLDANKGCSPENLSAARFDNRIGVSQRVLFCETLREISIKLDGDWSPALKSELRQIWQVFAREKVKIRLFEKDVPSSVRAMAEAFTENTKGDGFNANLYLRPERTKDKSFFPILMHELQHVLDMHTAWKNKIGITEAELEKRAFRIVGKISQESPDAGKSFNMPTFWEEGWKHLPLAEISSKREEKIEKFMRNNEWYKHLLANPQKYVIGYASNQTTSFDEIAENPNDENRGERLPRRMTIRQTEHKIPQQIEEVSFRMAKPANPKNADELLRAALANEKNLYHKMDNFVYDQNLRLQCWKKQNITENYELNRSIARTQNGEALSDGEKVSSTSSKPNLPSCVLDLETIKSDATDTFWAAPYLDRMPIKFNHFTIIDGIPVARYTVLEPTVERFDQIASLYPQIKTFRAFVGTIFVSVADAQIIKFWGTSVPVSKATGSKSAKTYGSYSATAIRQKLASGIWVTTLLNTVAVTDEKDRMKPFSYVVKYQNYRQGAADVNILDDEAVAFK